MGVINTVRGYVAAGAMTEEDTVIDIGEKTVLEWDEWTKEGIKPIGVETMRNNPSIIKS